MMPVPPDAPLSVRLGARIGPELIASILVVILVVVGVSVALSGRRAPVDQGGIGAIPTASLAATAVESGSQPPPSDSPTPPPSQSVAARALVEIVDRLLDKRAALQAQVDKRTTDAVAIADLLREVNSSLVLQETPLADLAADPATKDLAGRIGAVNDETRDAARRALSASISNEKAYRDGASQVIAALGPLRAIRGELATMAGEPAA